MGEADEGFAGKESLVEQYRCQTTSPNDEITRVKSVRRERRTTIQKNKLSVELISLQAPPTVLVSS